jgi:predicted RNase H-like HicB family nuclease
MKARDILRRLKDAKLDIEANGAEMKYAVVFEKAATNWCAYVPDLPGCGTTGETPQDTRRSIEQAIEFHIEGLRLHEEPVPEPTAIVDQRRGPGGVNGVLRNP